MLAAQAIKAGDARVRRRRRQESMSNAPHYVYGMRGGIKLGDQTMVDGMINDGLWDSFGCCHMGELRRVHGAEGRRDARGAGRSSPPRATGRRSPRWRPGSSRPRSSRCEIPAKSGPDHRRHRRGAAEGHERRVARAAQAGVPEGRRHGDGGQRAGPQRRRERARRDVARLRARRTASRRWRASPATPPAAASRRDLFFAPMLAVRNLMKKTGTTIGDYDLIEANEAFAVQALADGRELGWDWDRVNVNGGAIALGHPIGASGARVLTTLLYALQDRGGRDRPRDALPRRRQRRGAQRGAGLMDARSRHRDRASPGAASPPAGAHRIGLGALLVAAAAQVAVPVPFTPGPDDTAAARRAGRRAGCSAPRGGARGAHAVSRARRCLGFRCFAGGSSGVVHLLGPDRRLPAGVSRGRGRGGLRSRGGPRACSGRCWPVPLAMAVIHARRRGAARAARREIRPPRSAWASCRSSPATCSRSGSPRR